MRRKWTSMLLVFTMLATLLPMAGWAQDDDTPNQADISQFDRIITPGGEELQTDDLNPYGYDANESFKLVSEQELTYFMNYDYSGTYASSNHRYLTVLDDFTPSFTLDSEVISQSLNPEGRNSGFAKNMGPYYQNNLSDDYILSYMKAVGFDPIGAQQDNFVAYLGFDKQSNRDGKPYGELKLWASYTNGETMALFGPYTVGGLNWMAQRNDYSYMEMTNHIALTAGDYDGDGIDTLVVYYPSDNGPELVEYQFHLLSDSHFEQLGATSDASVLTNPAAYSRYGEAIYSEAYTLSKPATAFPGVDLATGDYDGDGIEDLAVLSYAQQLSGDFTFNASTTESEWTSSNEAAAYKAITPQLATLKGAENMGSVFNSAAVQSTHLVGQTATDSQYTFNTNNKVGSHVVSYDSMVNPGLGSGDVDADGRDELIVAGYGATFVNVKMTEYTDSNFDTPTGTAPTYCFARSSRDASTLSVATIDQADTGFSVNLQKGSTNKMTAESTIGGVWGQLAVDCFAATGNSGAERVFINGDIFEDSNYVAAVASHPIVQQDKGEGSYIGAVAVGNFDARDNDNRDRNTGYEQVAFAIMDKESNSNYNAFVGMMGAKTVNATGAVTAYYTNTGENVFGKARGTRFEQRPNLILTTVDVDNDGIIARYNSSALHYSDPQVKVVLQASPYFGELMEDPGNGATTYTFTENYEYSTESSTTTSFGVGFSGELETSVVDVGLKLGYAGEWSKSFADTLTKSFSWSASAMPYDSVVVYRTPFRTYSYDIYNPDEEQWMVDAMAISVPQKPVYSQMAIDDYNAFVTYYNDTINNLRASASENRLPEGDYQPLKSIEEEYLGNEGNPWGYRSLWTNGSEQLCNATYQLGYNGSVTGSRSAEGSGTTKTVSQSNGFSFELEILTGFTLASNGGKAGAYVSLEQMFGNATSTTISSETETQGEVQNLDARALANELNVDEEIIRAYGFDWTFGRWSVDLGGAGEDVLVLGYQLFNLTAPAIPPQNLKAENVAEGTVALTWQAPETNAERGKTTGYWIYACAKDKAPICLNESLLPDAQTSFEATGLATNTEYTFYVVAEAKVGTRTTTSLPSNIRTLTTLKRNVPLTLVYDEDTVDVSATYLGDAVVTDSSKIPEDTLVYVEADAKDGYVITTITLETTEGETNITTNDGHFNFAIKGDTTITVSAERIINDYTTLYFDTEIFEADDLIGTVTAKAEGISLNSGANIEATAVNFEATPANGYVLKEWRIYDGETADGEPAHVITAIGDNRLRFCATQPIHFVQAVFVPAEDADVTRTLTVTQPEGGTITVTRANGMNVVPKGELTVGYGESLTVTLTADKYYSIDHWTGDLADQKASESITFKAMNDMTVGAVLYTPVTYTVTYAGVGDGELYADAGGRAIVSGSRLVPESTVDFSAVAGENHRVERWGITEGTITNFIDNSDALKTSDVYTLVSLGQPTDVKAYFKEIEDVAVTVNAAENGSITVKRGGETLTPNAEGIITARFGDQLTISAVADSGYELSALNINGGRASNGTTLTVVAPTSIEARFTRKGNTSGGGGGGFGGISSNAIIIHDSTHGSITSDKTKATRGSTITLTVSADSGYALNTLTVTDADGNEIETAVNGGRVTFFMPETAVTVDATFVESGAVPKPGMSDLTDVSTGDYFYDAVQWALDAGITSGTSSTTFSPKRICTRAEAVTFIWRANGSPAPDGSNMPFVDVNTDAYYATAVQWAVKQGIVAGTSATTFSPDMTCTRAHIVAMLHRSVGEKSVTIDNPFTDVQAGDYFANAVLWAVDSGITVGTTATTFTPNDGCTRAQIVTFIYRQMH